MAVARQIRETIKSTFSRPRGNPASTRRFVDHWRPNYVEDISCVNFEIAAASWKTSKTMSATRLRETITECLADVQSDSVDAQRKALRTLASLTKVSPQNRSLLARTDGVVSTLLTLTKISSSIIRILALSILFKLSLNPDLKWNLAEMETIHLLNSIILSTSSPEINRLVCSLICSLAMLDKNKAKFGVAGTVQVLVGTISGPRCPASHHLLSSLAELVQFHGNCTVAVRSGAVQVLFGVVESKDGEDLAGTSLAVLGHVARFNEGLNALIRTDQIVSSMLNVLRGRCMLSKEGAAEILLGDSSSSFRRK